LQEYRVNDRGDGTAKRTVQVNGENEFEVSQPFKKPANVLWPDAISAIQDPPGACQAGGILKGCEILELIFTLT